MNNSSVGSPRTSPARGAAAVVGGGSGSGKCFGPDGCPAVANGRRCGETRNLQIIQEFKRLYETKMKQIDDAAGGDCVQAKINLQQEWIRDLTDQNEMLVRVVEELEVEAAERVTMLEEKLQQSAKCACEVMGSYKDFSINFLADFQKMGYIQNDLNNLIEVLRRVKQYGVWNAKDLRFYTINVEDLTSDSALARRNLNGSDEEECRCQCNCKREGDANNRNCKHEKLAKEKDKKVNELQEKIARLRGTIEENEDAKKTYIQYQELKKSMLDMRDALTAEVAEKHDAVLSLRREVHMLEEQCRKADQQVHFKDDIIKELRKEIKQLKLQAEEVMHVDRLSQENAQLCEEVKLMRVNVERMRTSLLDREISVPIRPTCNCQETQTASVEVFGKCSCMSLVKAKKTEQVLVDKLEQECRDILQDSRLKDQQLYEQNELITLLVKKLFCVYKALRRLDDNAQEMRYEEEKDSNERKMRALEADNEMLKQSIIKAKKNLDKLEQKAEEYLEERDDIKRKHRESLDTIETLQRENQRSIEALQTLEQEKKSHMARLQDQMVQELEDYEKKHKDSLETVSTLKGELQKYKDEQRDSLTKVRTLSDENRAQADQIAALHEKLRQSLARPPTTSTGVHAKMQSRDIGLDPAVPATRHVGITNAPETKNASTLSEIESMIVPAHHYHHKGAPKSFRSVAIETEDVKQLRSRRHPHRYERTSSPESQEDSTEGAVVMTVGKRRAGVVEMVDALKPVTLDAYGCGPDVQCEIFDFVPNKLTATADKDNIEKYVNEDIVEALVEPVAARKKDNQGSARHSGEAEVLYDGKHAYRTSNESVGSEDAYTVMSEKPAKSVRIALEPKGARKRRTAHLTESDSDENISGTVYYSVKEDSRAEEAPFMKKNAQDWYQGPNKVPKSRNAESGSRSTSPRSTSPQARRPAEELQTVVHDLNESVSRIIEKTPNEKATRERIAKLEAQLRAALAQKERDVDVERQKRNQEVENLKLTIREMEKALQNKEENSVNLQNAVDLYLNSINVLERSEEHYKNEVAQQRITIANLQEALIATKQQLDELKEKCQKDLEDKCILLGILDVSVNDLEKQCYHYYDQYLNSAATVEFLRDEILNLEVQKFELTQDILLLEARLLKYQEVSKQYECICGLKKEIKRLHVEVSLFKGEVENLQNYIRRCHQEIDSTKTILGKYLGSECSEYCIKQNESVVTLAQDTICYTEDLQCQIAVLDSALKREQKINAVQSSRIEELQGIIGAKNLELNRANDAYQDVKGKLDTAIARSKSLEDALKELQEQLNEIEMSNLYQDEKTDICHGELDMCLDNLQTVKLKLRNQYKAMADKMQELAQLQAECKIHSNNAEVYKRDLENTRIRSRDEIIELKHTIRDLKEKLANTEDKNEDLNKEIKRTQVALVDASHHESKIKQDFHKREKHLTEKIHSAQSEEMRLLDVVTQLEHELANMKNELDSRGHQLETAKETILQMNNDALMKQQITQDEMNRLKNEVNALIQQQGAHKADNERLQQQIECMKCCLRQNEVELQTAKQQLEKCLCDLKNVEQEKNYLEQRNVTLMGTLERMQVSLQTKTESLTTVEMELLEVKTSRDEICNESRNVVFNVKAWLDEQKKINEQLKQKLQKKNALILKYEQDRRREGVCECNARPGYIRQRGGAVQPNYFESNAPPLSRSPWSLDSRGSGSESPTSSVSSTAADWYEYEDGGYDAITEEPTAQLWIHRVESMTEELQRSNRFWKKKINDSEFMVTKDK